MQKLTTLLIQTCSKFIPPHRVLSGKAASSGPRTRQNGNFEERERGSPKLLCSPPPELNDIIVGRHIIGPSQANLANNVLLRRALNLCRTDPLDQAVRKELFRGLTAELMQQIL